MLPVTYNNNNNNSHIKNKSYGYSNNKLSLQKLKMADQKIEKDVISQLLDNKRPTISLYNKIMMQPQT